MKSVLKYCLLIIIVFALGTCKKYPENTLWFKNIKRTNFFDNGMCLTKFTVNGIDSLKLLDAYFGSKAKGGTVSNYSFNRCWTSSDLENVGCADYPIVRSRSINYLYSKNAKYISISCEIDTSIFRRNIFVDNETRWQIIKFDIKGGKRIIKKTVSNNTYELQLEDR